MDTRTDRCPDCDGVVVERGDDSGEYECVDCNSVYALCEVSWLEPVPDV